MSSLRIHNGRGEALEADWSRKAAVELMQKVLLLSCTHLQLRSSIPDTCIHDRITAAFPLNIVRRGEEGFRTELFRQPTDP